MLYVLLSSLFLLVKECQGGPQEDRLLEDLFRQYNTISRPLLNDNSTVVVGFKMEMQQIIKLDEKNEMLESMQWLHFEWNDPRLSWSSEAYEGLESIVVPIATIWKPDVILYNTVDEDIDSRYESNAHISQNGGVIWIPPGVFHSSCAINIEWFPFDTQKCRMKFGSWSYNSQHMNLTLLADQIDLSTYVQNGEWDLIEASAVHNSLWYDCCQMPFVDVTFTIVLRRRPNFYVITLLVPCSFVTILTLFNFLQPADSGEKVGLGITVLLSLSVFQLIVADTIPRTSISVPILGAYFCGVMCLCTASLVMTLISLKCHHTKPEMQKMPKWMRVVLCQWLGRVLRMQRPGQANKENSQLDRKDNKLKIKCCLFKTSEKCLQEISMDPAIFSADSPYPCTEKDKGFSKTGKISFDKDKTFSNKDQIHPTVINKEGHAEVSNSIDNSKVETIQNLASYDLKGIKTQLTVIIDELKVLTKKVEDEEAVAAEVHDWQHAALVIDRLCFWICSVAFIIGTICVFCRVP